MTAFVVNTISSTNNGKRFGTSNILAGLEYESLSDTAYTKCSGDFFDTGFQKMTVNPCHGKYIVIRRIKKSSSWQYSLNINELRLY